MPRVSNREVGDKYRMLLLVSGTSSNFGLRLQTLNPDFYVDFGAEPDGPVLAHETR